MAQKQPLSIREILMLQRIYRRAEFDIINELARLRSRGLIDYHAVGTLLRVQKILLAMQDRAGKYIPRMIDRYFYANHPERYKRFPRTAQEHKTGYINAIALSADEVDMSERLKNDLMFKLVEASNNIQDNLTGVLLGRQAQDIFRQKGLEMVARQQATGMKLNVQKDFVEDLQRNGITAFTDKSGRKWSLRTYADMVTRTTSRQAEVMSVLTKFGDHDLFMISKNGSTCPICAPLEGRVYSKSGKDPIFPPLASAFGKIDPNGPNSLSNSYLNIHPNCLVPGGTILAEGVMAHSSRDYDGRVIRLVTSGGDEITVTPNHPVLTDKGFIAAGLLSEGDKIFKTTREYGRLFGESPYDIKVPTAIEDVPDAIFKASECSTCSVVGTTEDFHGDGIADSEVHIVFSNSLVKGETDSISGKGIAQDDLPSAHGRRFEFFPNRTFPEVGVSSLHPTDSIMGGGGFVSGVEGVTIQSKKFSDISVGLSDIRSDFGIGHSLIMKGKHCCEFIGTCFKIIGRDFKESLLGLFGNKTIVKHRSLDSVWSYAKMLCNLRITEPLAAKRLKSILCDNGLIVDELVHVESFHYSGKVYNLETEYGFYSYNSIVTHNCLHVLVPWTPAGKTPEQIEKIQQFSNFTTNPVTKDPRSQRQVDEYKRKEEGRAKILADIDEWKKIRLAGIGPASFQTFLKHKLADDEKYKAWLDAYRKL